MGPLCFGKEALQRIDACFFLTAHNRSRVVRAFQTNVGLNTHGPFYFLSALIPFPTPMEKTAKDITSTAASEMRSPFFQSLPRIDYMKR